MTESASVFDEFGGHYSVRIEGVEYARFAPSPHWSDYFASVAEQPGFSYVWVPGKGDTSPTGASDRQDVLSTALSEIVARIEAVTPREALRPPERRTYWQGVRDALAVVRGYRDVHVAGRGQ